MPEFESIRIISLVTVSPDGQPFLIRTSCQIVVQTYIFGRIILNGYLVFKPFYISLQIIFTPPGSVYIDYR